VDPKFEPSNDSAEVTAEEIRSTTGLGKIGLKRLRAGMQVWEYESVAMTEELMVAVDGGLDVDSGSMLYRRDGAFLPFYGAAGRYRRLDPVAPDDLLPFDTVYVLKSPASFTAHTVLCDPFESGDRLMVHLSRRGSDESSESWVLVGHEAYGPTWFLPLDS
jgi:hypothetical protein